MMTLDEQIFAIARLSKGMDPLIMAQAENIIEEVRTSLPTPSMFPSEQRIALAELAAEALPDSRLVVKDVSPTYVPEGYREDDLNVRIKNYPNGSCVWLYLLPF